jgi:hypothetical protein
MGRAMTYLGLAVLAATGLLQPARAQAQDVTAFEEVLKILKRSGMIDEAGENKVKALYAAEQKRTAPKWLDGFELKADFRARFDGSYFDEDALGGESVNRGRGRYRARFGFTKKVGDHFRIGMRLASGSSSTGDRRSGNVSFGEGSNDEFSPDPILIDQVFAEMKVVDSANAQAAFTFGKVANPFVGNVRGPDNLLFDGDITLEGGHLTSSYRVGESTRFFGSVGGFIVDEISGAKDPKLFGAQIGFETKPVQSVTFGIRASGMQFHSVDAPFITTATANGNLAAFEADGSRARARIGETTAYLQLSALESWPLVLYAQAIKNFDASSLPGQSHAEDDAYGFGFELGDNARFVKIGAGWFHVEANSVMSQFTDSDLFDGFTNRQGLMFFASRKVTPNVELRLTFFDAKEIEDEAAFAVSAANADRKRVQADAILSF